jgi:NCS1 family nucleobase:cation symporter-1
MALGTGLGVWLFSNQQKYTGPIAKHFPAIGDIAFEAGFVIAGLLYLGLRLVPGLGSSTDTPTLDKHEPEPAEA